MEGSSVHSKWLTLVPTEGWSDHSQGGALFATANHAHAELHEAGYTALTDGAGWQRSDLSGRVPLMELRYGSETYLRRRFQHGGLLRAITGERFRDPLRPLREVQLALRLKMHGILTPDVVAARAQPLGLSMWGLDLITRRMQGATDLESVMAAAHRGEVPLATWRGHVRKLGGAVAELHSARFLHADLTPKNVLLDGEKMVFIDLDRSRFVESGIPEELRRENLRRLYRYVARREANASTRLLQRTDYMRFFSAFSAHLGKVLWKEDWRAIEAEHARHAGKHRAGWLAERLFAKRGPGPAWRD